MNKWIYFFCLLIVTSELFAQKDAFLVKDWGWKGLAIDHNWKFHPGDNPAWAKPGFDAGSWEEIQPMKDIHKLPVSPDSRIGWFRIRLKIDRSLVGKPLALQVNQNGASEIYLNGQLLTRYGIIGPGNEQTKGYWTYYDAVGIQFDTTDAVLAVRFATQENLPYLKYPPGNHAMILKINDVAGAAEYINYSKRYIPFHYFEAGVFLVLFVIHFRFFLMHKSQKANLFFSIGTFVAFFSSVVGGYGYFNSVPLSIKMYSMFIFSLFGTTIYNTSLFLAIHTLLGVRRGLYFWLLVTYSALGTVITLSFYDFGFESAMFSLSLNTLTLCGLAIKASRNGKTGFGIIIGGLLFYWALFIGFVLINRGYLPDVSLSAYYTLRDLLFHVSVLGLPISISIYLSREYGLASKNLKAKLLEVQHLSEAKEADLLQKNAELQAAILQGQTTERQRMAADLHDNLGTTLSALQWNLEAVDKSKMTVAEQAVHTTIQQQVSQAYKDVRLLSHNLLPGELAKQGLAVALQHLVQKLNRNTTVRFSLCGIETLPRLPAQIEFELYSICLELLNNSIRHARATEAQVVLNQIDGLLTLRVSDNGTGLVHEQKEGRGLQNVAARVEALGGTWSVESGTNQGTENRITVPVRVLDRVSE